MVRDETGLQFFLLKHKVDWNVRYETPAGKAWHGRPRRRAEGLPPAESEFPTFQSTIRFTNHEKKRHPID